MHLSSSIQYLPKVGPVMAKKLEKLNIFTIQDLLWHLPFRYEDYSQIVKINQIAPLDPVTIIGSVISAKNAYTKFHKNIQTVVVGDDTGTIKCMWFNQPYLIKNFLTGTPVAISGKADYFGSKLQFTSPDFEIVKANTPLLHTAKIIPIYPETAGLTSKWIRSRIHQILQTPIMDYLPEELIKKYHFPSIFEAYQQLHYPNDLNNLEKYRQRLAFDELFLLELTTLLHRHLWQKQKLINPLKANTKKIETLIQSLPFQLTSSQQKVVSEILADLTKSQPMNRLLQGDVGSGKTVVAAIAMYLVYLNQGHSLFMAPTEILAEQHYATLKQLFKPFKLNIQLHTSSHKQKSTMKQSNNETTNILVGTHALLENKVQLDQVKLVIIDEQHRFGVAQRALLREKGDNPHVLTMTATPIPRTIALTLYGDLDLSTIDEMPMGRKNIKTWVVPIAKRVGAYQWIEKQIKDHQSQAFIVCPFIEPSETMTGIKAATEEFIKLQKHIFPKLKLALLHGKIKAADKQQILNDFRIGKYDILVATPVVEVGIDIANATIMLIEAAERFGLAQLHQLRGRVGRSDRQSYCLLFASDYQNSIITRLKQMEHTQSGIKLAEYDLQARGPGEVYGIKQHGQNFLKIASYSDLKLIETAKKEAAELILSDPPLNHFPLLKQRLFSSKIQEITPD